MLKLDDDWEGDFFEDCRRADKKDAESEMKAKMKEKEIMKTQRSGVIS